MIKMEWQEVFNSHGNNWIDLRDDITSKHRGITMEELYQIFKARLLDEQTSAKLTIKDNKEPSTI